MVGGIDLGEVVGYLVGDQISSALSCTDLGQRIVLTFVLNVWAANNLAAVGATGESKMALQVDHASG